MGWARGAPRLVMLSPAESLDESWCDLTMPGDPDSPIARGFRSVRELGYAARSVKPSVASRSFSGGISRVCASACSECSNRLAEQDIISGAPHTITYNVGGVILFFLGNNHCAPGITAEPARVDRVESHGFSAFCHILDTWS
jgi:hypothetical protein